MQYIPFLLWVVLLGSIYLSAKKKNYDNELSLVSKEDYALKDFMPVGFLIVDKIGMKNIKKINNGIFEKLIALYGGIDAERQCRIYVANKVVISFLFVLVLYAFQMANGDFSFLITILGPVVFIGIYYLMDTSLETKMKKRSDSIKYDFPEFVSKLTLLINAGLTFDAAWEKIVLGTNKDSVLNKEIRVAYNDMNANIPKEVVLRNFSRRCKVNFITKFCNIVSQNVNKGTSDLTLMLDSLANECWQERQAIAKQKGEEASTRLLFPMLLMLFAVFIITIVPAILQMFNF